MKILILEDNHERMTGFNQIFMGHEILHTETVYDTIRALSTTAFDWVFLDHDLGGEEMVESGPGTGYEVACWLELNPINWPEQGVIIHSLNQCGANRIVQALPAPSTKIPFVWNMEPEDVLNYLEEHKDNATIRNGFRKVPVSAPGLPEEELRPPDTQ